MTYDNANDVVYELFESLFSRYQIGLETLIRGSDFIFDSVQPLCYKCHKTNFKSSGSYIESPDWMKNKKAIRNLKNKDDKCFQNLVMVALNYGEIESHPE